MARHWALEERKRQSEIIGNWKPWQHSTGPRSETGKRIVSRNVRRGHERRQRELAQAKIELAAAIAKVARLTSRKAGNWPSTNEEMAVFHYRNVIDCGLVGFKTTPCTTTKQG